MAEDLCDGEFWLPSQFLTDEDILMDFSVNKKKDEFAIGLGFNPDLDFLGESVTRSTGTESDEDELLAELTRQMTRSSIKECSVHSKEAVLSSSPQSTLCGCVCNQESSRGSLSPSDRASPPPPQPPPQAAAEREAYKNDATWDILYKAAGEVARMKVKSEANSGTGFFDCSSKGQLYPPPPTKPTPLSAVDNYPHFYSQPQFHHLPQGWGEVKPSMNKVVTSRSNRRALGLPPSAWPHFHNLLPRGMPPQPAMFPKRDCPGTGVFLPRPICHAPETRKNCDANVTKLRSGKAFPSQPRRTSRTSMAANQNHEIQLPQEWMY